MHVTVCVCVCACVCACVCVCVCVLVRFFERSAWLAVSAEQGGATKAAVRSELREIKYASLTVVSKLSEDGFFGQVCILR